MMGDKRYLLLICVIQVSVMAQGIASSNARAEARPRFSGKPFAAKFQNIAPQAGVSMKFISGGEKSKRYITEANGSGLALFDFDNDGWLDIFLPNGSLLEGAPAEATSRLYRNQQNGTFADITRSAQAGFRGWGSGVCVGDYDNDGFTDLFATYRGADLLLHNEKGQRFLERASEAGLRVAAPLNNWSTGCSFVDYDRDGRLDLFVTEYQRVDLKQLPAAGSAANCMWEGMPVFCGPRGLPFGTSRLYRNLGEGRFADVSIASGIAKAAGYYGFSVLAADLTEDGWPDIMVASDSTPSLLFRNNRDGTFTELGAESGIAFSEHGFEQGGMGLAMGDYDGDGRLDILKTNFAGDHPNLYRYFGKGIYEDRVIASGLGVNPFYVAWGVGLEDFDNDGLLDVLQVNGHVYPELDAKPGREKYRNPRLLYRGLPEGRFEDVSALAGEAIAALHSSRGAAFGDFNNDGAVDVAIMNMSEAPELLQNQAPTNAWIRFRLRGVKSNRSGIGAIVRVQAGAKRQTRIVLSQSSYLSVNDLRPHFGLGESKVAEKVEVLWPDGRLQTYGPFAAGATQELVEAP
jgi:enediyne biosynthesis protein E4